MTQYPKYAGHSELARILAELEQEERPQGYRRQQIHMWWHRRSVNKFPEKEHVLYDGKWQDLFDVESVITWKKNYTPSTGGRRKNAQK